MTKIFKPSTKYKKEFKKLNHHLKDEVKYILNLLANDHELDPKYKNHKLRGNYNDKMELHVRPDLLLIYEIRNDVIILYRLGSHSELFKK